MRFSGSRFPLAFGLTALFACFAYGYLSLTIEEGGLSKLRTMPQRISAWFKSKTEAWEKSTQGDIRTCTELLRRLIAATDKTNTWNFSWPTPNFVKSLTGTNGRSLKENLCKRYSSSSKPRYNVKLDSKPWLTNAESSYFLTSKDHASLGELIHILITIRNSDSRQIASSPGGDYFKIRLENPFTMSSVAASRVRYLGNGTYTAQVKAHWSGRHFVRVFFGQSAHFVDVLKRLTASNRPLAAYFQGSFQAKQCGRGFANMFCEDGPTERIQCFCEPPKAASRSICNFTNRNGEPWYCDAPKPPLTCRDWKSLYTKRRRISLELFQIFPPDDR